MPNLKDPACLRNISYKENYGKIKNNLIIGIKDEVLKVNSILSIFKYRSI